MSRIKQFILLSMLGFFSCFYLFSELLICNEPENVDRIFQPKICQCQEQKMVANETGELFSSQFHQHFMYKFFPYKCRFSSFFYVQATRENDVRTNFFCVKC